MNVISKPGAEAEIIILGNKILGKVEGPTFGQFLMSLPKISSDLQQALIEG